MTNYNFYQPLYSLLLLIVFITSCNAQNKPTKDLLQAKDSIEPKSNPTWIPNTVPIVQAKTKASDIDPYFTETTTINSPYGPQSITRNIVQDRNGSIWLASWEGIIRYDGKTFTNFTNKDSLRRYHTFSVLEDKAGNLWFGSIGAGLYRYDGFTFTNFTTKDGLAHDKVGCMLEDKKGNIWFGTMGGISRYDGKTFHNFTTKDGLTNDDINSIVEDKTGKFWIGTRGEACTYDGKTFSKLLNLQGLSFKNVRSIVEDKKGNIWLGGQDGLFRTDGKTFTNITTNFTGYVYEDRKGNIWISAFDGSNRKMTLSRYDKKYLPDEQSNLTPIKKEDGQVFGIIEDKNGNIWFGTEGGVCRYDGKSFTTFTK